MNIALLSIGDEILIGQIVNTNVAWLGSQITNVGFKIVATTTVGDSFDTIADEIRRLASISDVVIMTGGLGATHDDITKHVWCEVFGDSLAFHQPTLELLNERYIRQGREFTERNKLHAFLPSSCTVLPNSIGSAPGMMTEYNGTLIFSLPGVPYEMKAIFNESVQKFIELRHNQLQTEVVVFKTIMTSGIVESSLADLIGDPKEFLNEHSSLAFLPSAQGVRLRFGYTAKSKQLAEENLEAIINRVKPIIQPYIFAETDQKLIEVVSQLLQKNGKTIATVESCTGGMLGAEFVSISGSSSWYKGGLITYSNQSKTLLVNVRTSLLEEFGAVSEEVAIEMASQCQQLFSTDYAISITGIAGPTGWTDSKPVGLVWIGIATPNGTNAYRFQFGTDRQLNRERSTGTALHLLLKELRNLPN
jgi:nicotinamide-nucleotide amidase